MSLDNTLIDEFAYTFEEEFENDCVKPFPQTVHTDVPLPGSGELLFPQDVIAMSQIVSNPPFDGDLAKNMLPNSTGPSQSPSTDEGVSSSQEGHGYEDPFISQASVSKQTSNIRACFEKVLQEESQSSESSPNTQQSPNYLYLERDPAELKKSSMPVLFNSYDGFQIDAPLSFHSSDAMMNSDLVNSPESYEFVLPEEPLNMPLPRSQPMSFIGFTPDMFKVDFLQESEQKQSNNNRQSKYKNSYSLAEEQAQRYLKDWLGLTKTNIKKIQEEERISVQARIEEARKLESVIKIYDSIDQESNNFKNKIKLAEDAKKKGNDSKAELAALVRDRDVLMAARKGYQKNLIEKLKYRRFSLTPSLSKLVNDNPNAFMKRDELARYLKEYPKFRTLKCMKSFFEVNMKFGLLVSRISVDFLSTKSDPTMISNSTVELKYWLIKSPMENKNKRLFTDEHSRNHIRNELNKIYLELEEKAKTKLAESDMKLFHEVFNGQQGVMNLEFGAENNFSEDQIAEESGKRAIEFVPSSKEKGAKKTKKN